MKYYLKKLFLNGLLAILPLTLTLAIFNMSFRLISAWLTPLNNLAHQTFLKNIPHAEIILAIIIIFIIGTLYNIFILRSVIDEIEKLLFKIPLIQPVYSGIRQLIKAFSIQDKISFKKIVLIEFPRKGLYSLGFLTSELSSEISPNKKEKFYNVFIPTTPNPTSGYLVIIPELEISIIDITRQEAMAMIISGGIIQPKRFEKEKL